MIDVKHKQSIGIFQLAKEAVFVSSEGREPAWFILLLVNSLQSCTTVLNTVFWKQKTMRRDLQEHHQLPSVNNLILAFSKFLSVPVLNRPCTSILTSNAAVLKYSQNWVQNTTNTLGLRSGHLHVNSGAHGPSFTFLLLLRRLLEI